VLKSHDLTAGLTRDSAKLRISLSLVARLRWPLLLARERPAKRTSRAVTSGNPRFHLLTRRAPKPRLAASGIRALMVPLGQLGHEAKAASTGRTQVSGHSRG
jgi:hypothetical protein